MKFKMPKLSVAFALLSVLLLTDVTGAARILALFPMASRSHINVFGTITKALAAKGHQFVTVTSFPTESLPPNMKEISVYDVVAKHFNAFNVTSKREMTSLLKELTGITADVCREVMQKEELKKLANPKEGEKFDLIIASNFFSEWVYGFSHVYNAPIIAISPGGPMPTTNSATGNIVLPSYYPCLVTGFSDRMVFKERVINTLASVAFPLFYKFYLERYMEIEMRAAFGEDVPGIAELQKNVSLVLINNHFSMNQARPLVPNLVEVGGLHIKPPKALPQDLKSFLDGAGKDGAIYFSLGSNLRSASFPVETRDAFIKAFSQLKQRILWKWEQDGPIPGQTKNVKLGKWLPQQDVLAHPNIKLFITHGGLLSFQEATSRGVPLIGIPYFGDQDMNMQRVVDLKVGVKLDATNLTTENILNAIKQVLEDPTYSSNMKKLKEITSDQIDNPLDRAVYWIEYVIRHKGAKHLRPAAADLEWYQIYLLDVVFVAFVLPNVVMPLIMLFIGKFIWRKLFSKKEAKSSEKKTQ